MNIARNLIASTISLVAISVSAIAETADAAYLTFFGEDAGAGESTRLLSTPNANAARTSFFSNLSGVGTETFESIATGATSPINASFGADIATINGNGSVRSVPSGASFGRYPISGDKFYQANNAFNITFTTAQAAFGFYGVDIGDFNGRVTLTLSKVGGGVETLTVPNTRNGAGGNALYFGLIASDPSNLFTSISFGNTNARTDIFAFDNFSIGRQEQVVRPVPVPGLAVGVVFAAGILGRKHIKKRKQLINLTN